MTGASGTFWLENLPSDFKMVGEDNAEYSSLGMGSSFKIVTTNLGYTGKINFDVKTDIRPSAGIKFTAPGVQNLFSIIRKDPLPAYSSEAMFKAAFSQIIIEKAVERTDTHKDVENIRHDLSKIKVRIMKKDGKYDKTFNLDKTGFLEVRDLLPGDYTIKEIEAPQGLTLNSKEFSVKLEAGKKLIFQLYNQEKVGTIKLIKEIKKTTTEDAKNVMHDFTKVKVRIQSQTLNPVFDKEYYLNKEGTLLLEGMPIGDYTITEIEVPPTMQKTARIQYVTVMEGKIATAKSTATLINEETVTKIHIKKTLVNPTDGVFTKRYTPDYTKIKIRIHSVIPEVT
ncbi:MAG: MSCRAMM family protein, partial [Carnobacterium maltaromaticum]